MHLVEAPLLVPLIPVVVVVLVAYLVGVVVLALSLVIAIAPLVLILVIVMVLGIALVLEPASFLEMVSLGLMVLVEVFSLSGVQVAAVRLLGVPSLAHFILLVLHLVFLCPDAAPFLPLELLFMFVLAVGFGLCFLHAGLSLVYSFILVLIGLILVKPSIVALPAVVLRKIVAAALTLKKLATSSSGAVGPVIVVVVRGLTSHLILVPTIVASSVTVVIAFIIARALAALAPVIAVAQ